MVSVALDLIGAHAFVAGGTSGINLGIAEGFASAGARVWVMSRSPQKVEAAMGRLRALEAEAEGSAADGRDPEATAAALQQAHQAFGAIDVLVSGAAGTSRRPHSGCRPTPSGRCWTSICSAPTTSSVPRTRCCASPGP